MFSETCRVARLLRLVELQGYSGGAHRRGADSWFSVKICSGRALCSVQLKADEVKYDIHSQLNSEGHLLKHSRQASGVNIGGQEGNNPDRSLRCPSRSYV